MQQGGRVSFLAIFAVLAVALLVGLALFSGSSPTKAASAFMTALQEGNVDRLMELSTYPDGTEQQIRKEWKFTFDTAAPYYNFAWRPVFQRAISDESSVVKIKVVKSPENPNSYEEDFQIPMVRINGKWKVDLLRLNRAMYPSLPRVEKTE